jgi:HAD superfamily hydrolase (TIGR01509 family)
MIDFFEAVFFDMDGLTVDSEPQWLLSEQEVVQPFGYVWTQEDQVACLGGPLSKLGDYMSQRVGNKESSEYFVEELIRIQANRMRSNTTAMPGAIELINSLRSHGIKTALVSASPRVIIDAVLDNIGHDLFPFSLSGDDVRNTKPDPEAYLRAAQISGSNIADCLVFEDSLPGMKAAIDSGAWLIAVPHLVHVEESTRVRSINSLQQLNIDKLRELKKDFSTSI